MRKLFATGALLLVGSCSGESGVGPCACAVPTVSATAAWGGSEVIVTSPDFIGPDTVPVVLARAETLAVRAVGPESIAVMLPSNDDAFELSLKMRGGAEMRTPSIRVYGFLGESNLPEISGAMEPYPYAGNPVGLAYYHGQVARINLRTNAVAPFGSSADTGYSTGCMMGPVVSVQGPDRITVGRGGCRAYVLDVATMALVDTGPLFNSAFSAINVGPGRWIASRKNLQFVQTAPGTSYDDPCGEGWGFIVAPAPQTAIVSINCDARSGTAAVPVWDRGTLQHQYMIAATRKIEAGAFSGSGDTLYVLGRTSAGSLPAIWAVNSATGAVLDSALIDSLGDINAMAIDAARGRLYVAEGSFYAGKPFTMRVYDLPHLARRATMRLPSPVQVTGDYRLQLWRLIVGADGILYQAMTSWFDPVDQPPMLYRWSLLP